MKIKGRSYEKEVHRTPEMNFAKVVDQIRERLVQAISTVSGDYNNEMTVHSSDLSNVPPDVSDRIQKYRNQSTVADATKALLKNNLFICDAESQQDGVF